MGRGRRRRRRRRRGGRRGRRSISGGVRRRRRRGPGGPARGDGEGGRDADAGDAQLRRSFGKGERMDFLWKGGVSHIPHFFCAASREKEEERKGLKRSNSEMVQPLIAREKRLRFRLLLGTNRTEEECLRAKVRLRENWRLEEERRDTPDAIQVVGRKVSLVAHLSSRRPSLCPDVSLFLHFRLFRRADVAWLFLLFSRPPQSCTGGEIISTTIKRLSRGT